MSESLAVQKIPRNPPKQRRGMIWTSQFTPTTPTPLSPTAPIVPATWVPCPEQAKLVSEGSLSLFRKSHPWTSSIYPFSSSSMPLPGISPGLVQRFAARSSCVRSIPESMTATITEDEPVCRSQASGASMSASWVPPVWPVLFSPHSSG